MKTALALLMPGLASEVPWPVGGLTSPGAVGLPAGNCAAPVAEMVSGVLQRDLTIGGDGSHRPLHLVVLAPERPSGKPLPVVVWSQGANATLASSLSPARAIARGGYFVLIPRHADALDAPASPPPLDRSAGRSTSRPAPIALGGEKAWALRAADIRNAVDHLADVEHLLPTGMKADEMRIAVVGEGLGAFTVLLSVGAEPRWAGRSAVTADGRLKAVVTINLRRRPEFAVGDDGLQKVTVPALFINDAPVADTDRALKTLGERFGLTIEKPDPRREAAIVAVMTTFLDAKLKGDDGQAALLISGSAVAPFREFASLEER